MTSADIHKLLRVRFHAESHAYLQEVRNDAGFGASNSADAIVMSLWKSRGLEVHGIEIKISRGDWLRELKKPAKAEAIHKYCDRWWIVVAEKSIVKLEELPVSWGCLYVQGSKLMTLKEAPELKPEPLDKGFVAAMLKRATQGLIHPSQIADRIEEARLRGVATGESNSNALRQKHELLTQQVEEFEKEAGIPFYRSWDKGRGKTMGSVFKLVDEHGGVEGIKKDLERLQKTATSIVRTIETAIAALNPPVPDEAAERD